MSFVFFMKISLDLGGEAFHLLSSVAHVFQGTCIAMTIYNIPRQLDIFLCSRHTGPPSVQLLHQEDLNLPTFVKIGEPTDEDSFYNLEDDCEHNGDK